MNRQVAGARVAALSMIATLLFAAPAAAVENPAPTPASTDLIVAMAPAAVAVAVEDVVDVPSVTDVQAYDDTLATITVDARAVAQVVAELQDDPRIAYVEPDVEARIARTPADPYYSEQWGVPLTQIPAVWDTTTGSGDVVIAVIDTGVKANHSDLAGAAFVPGYDFVNDDEDPDDDNGHGTAAVGIIASQHNGAGTAGVCPRCRIMPLKAMDAAGTGYHGAIAAAIHHAIDNGADIINLSLGSQASSNTLHTAVQRAHAAGVLVVAAAGNAGVSTPFYPAGYPEALGVAASNSSDGKYSWSNYGTWVSMAAPGCNLTAAYAPATGQLGYTNFCGTSSAAPFAAGVAGLLAAARPGTTGPALTTALQTSARPATFVTAGRVDAAAALTLVSQPVTGGGESIDDGGSTGGGGGAPPEGPGTAEEPIDEGPAETATTVTPSATSVTFGDSVEIAGRVSTSSGSTEGAMVALLTRPAGDGEWTVLAEQPTDADGDVLFTHRPEQTAEYRLRFDGSTAQTTSLSDKVTISVRPVVTAAPATATAVAGRRAVVTGNVLPARSRTQIVLQRRTSTGWRAVDTGVTDAQGAFHLSAPAPVGVARYQVQARESAALAGARSSTFFSIGERSKISRVRPDARGDDAGNLNGEFIVLRNTGTTAIQLRDWAVRSRSADATFDLPAYRLPAGATVKVHSGKGRSGRGHVYLQARREVWRNRSGAAVVRHASGPVAARISW